MLLQTTDTSKARALLIDCSDRRYVGVEACAMAHYWHAAADFCPAGGFESDGVDTSFALLKYGYQVWLSADRQRFFLQGRRGQAILADPDTKLVLVQTSLSSDDILTLELATLWAAARAQLR